MSDFNEAIAEVLEKTAIFLDAVETEKQTAIREEREKLLGLMCTKYAEATGEEVSQELRKKLANSDSDIISVIEKLAEASPSGEELGGPSDRRGDAAPTTIKEASADADERFANWIMS